MLVVDQHTDDLRTYFYTQKHRAPDGVHGGRYKKTGKSGKELVLKVPPGTAIYREIPEEEEAEAGGEIEDGGEVFMDGGEGEAGSDAEDMLEEDGEDGEEAVELKRELVADLTEVGERFVLLRGGAGGKGNVHFKSSTNQAPTETTLGEPYEEGYFYLELRKIADAGLVGFPNAGKSTLLTKLSAARPKVAAYPFTTLKPMVGVVQFSGFARATVADIPGLIEGAHANVGLGHEFLRHITRCKLLLFVIDMAGSEAREPWDDLAALRREISMYDEELARREWLVVANKMDLDGAEEKLEIFRTVFERPEIIPISAMEEDGLDKLKGRLEELIAHRPS